MKRLLPFLFYLSLVGLGCKKPQSFDYKDLRNLRLENVGSDKANVTMDLVYFNPNNYGVNLKNVNCDIYLDSSLVGKFSLDTMMRIARNSEFTIPARMEVDMKNILKNTLSLFLNRDVLIGARGTTRVGKSGIYVTIPFTYEGKHKLNLF